MQDIITLRNFTSHALVFYGRDNQPFHSIDPDPRGPARCDIFRRTTGEIPIDAYASVPVNRVEIGDVYGLPEPAENTFYVVSQIVAQALNKTREDLLTTDEIVRDMDGKIVGARALSQQNGTRREHPLIFVTEVWREHISLPSVFKGIARDDKWITITYRLGQINVYSADNEADDACGTTPIFTLDYGGRTDGYISFSDLRRALVNHVALPPRFSPAETVAG